MARLAEYLQGRGETVTEFARRIGKSRVSVSRMLHDKQVPGKDTLQQIFKATEGAVTANDFMHPSLASEPAE